MQLFDPCERIDGATKRPTESTYSFYSRIAEPYFDRERNLLERWFATLPPKMQDHLHKDIRSGNDEKWHSAFWEMYLWTLFRGLGYDVDYEPQLSHTERSPDFLVEANGASAYVEARAIFGDTTANKRRAAIEETIEGVYHPDFAVWVQFEEEGPALPSLSRLKYDLDSWLSRLDADEIKGMWPIRSRGDLPTLRWNDRGWKLEFQPWLKAEKDRGISGSFPTIAGMNMGVWMSRDRELIRSALKKKSSRYGRLDRPLVVALLCNHSLPDDDDIIDALFGSSTIQVTWTSSGEVVDTRSVRRADGAWRGPRGKQNTRGSATLIARSLFPSSILSSVPRLWLHPEPEHEFVIPLPFPIRALDLSTGRLVDLDGQCTTPLNEILGVPPEWPGGHPWRS